MQGARREVEPGGQIMGAAGLFGVRGQRLPHPLHQQAVTPVLQHGQRQGVLQHLLQRGLIAAQRQVEVAGIQLDLCLRLLKRGGTRKQHRIDLVVCGRRKGKPGTLQRNA